MTELSESAVAAPPKTNRHHLRTALKVLLVLGLLYFLFQKGFISMKDTRNAFADTGHIVPAFAVLLISSFLGVIRWNWLLRAQGIELPFVRVFQLTYIGNFFNVALPGAVSGDLIKAIYIGKDLPGRRARAFGSIAFDRVAGLSALAFVSAGAFLAGWSTLDLPPLLLALKYVILFSALSAVAFYVYLFLVREHHDPLLFLFRRLESRFARAGSLTRIYEGIRHYHHHRWVVLKVLALSVLVHLAVGWACLNFAHALGEPQVLLLQTYIVVPLGLLVTAVPVLPAGVGTGHAAFLYLFHLMGSQRGADVFTLIAINNLVVGALGGLIYLKFRSLVQSET